MGITMEQWLQEFEDQQRRCACCFTTEPVVADTRRAKPSKHFYGEVSRWHTDHEHRTKRFRGILCSKCNRTIGLLGDTVELIERRIVSILGYLERAKRRQAVAG